MPSDGMKKLSFISAGFGDKKFSGSSGIIIASDTPKEVADVSFAAHNLRKVADLGMAPNAMGLPVSAESWLGGDMKRMVPPVQNPLLSAINFYLPQDRRILSQWLRYWDTFHAIVGSVLDMHAELVSGVFYLSGIHDPKVLKIYNDCVEKLNLQEILYYIIREYFGIGEAWPLLRWNSKEGYFDAISCVNPDYVYPRSLPLAGEDMVIEVEPSEDLKSFVNSTDPQDMELVKKLDPNLVAAVKQNRYIRFSSFNMTGIIRKVRPYDVRGTSIVLRALRELMLEQVFLEALTNIAKGHIRPVWLWKLGDSKNDILPSEDELTSFRELLLAGQYDPMFQIVGPYAVSVEVIGSTGKFPSLETYLNWIRERVMIAMFTHENALTGSGPTWANTSVAYKIMNQRYIMKRALLERYMITKVFTPIARAHNFKKPKSDELLLPTIEWVYKLDLTDVDALRNFLQKYADKTMLSSETLFRVFGLDRRKEMEAVKADIGTVFDPLWQDYRKRYYEKNVTKFLADSDQGVPQSPVAKNKKDMFAPEDLEAPEMFGVTSDEEIARVPSPAPSSAPSSALSPAPSASALEPAESKPSISTQPATPKTQPSVEGLTPILPKV